MSRKAKSSGGGKAVDTLPDLRLPICVHNRDGASLPGGEAAAFKALRNVALDKEFVKHVLDGHGGLLLPTKDLVAVLERTVRCAACFSAAQLRLEAVTENDTTFEVRGSASAATAPLRGPRLRGWFITFSNCFFSTTPAQLEPSPCLPAGGSWCAG
jgi:hypothetical protein